MAVKIDLITGFLGSGKTTFIKNYAKHLISLGERIGILENDFGAVNVDMMLLQELRGPNCELEMIAGGCDYDCHIRRFKTKLIAMAMSGYTRVIVEPSGIFDTDEFFDLINDEPLDSWYEMGSVITLVDSNQGVLDSDSSYLFSSQLATSGIVVFSKSLGHTKEELVDYLNNEIKKIGCIRVFKDDVILGEYGEFSFDEFEKIKNSGYHSYSYQKKMVMDNNKYCSLYFMNIDINRDSISRIANELFGNPLYGNVSRVKGFIFENNTWYLVNVTKGSYLVDEINDGQNVLIVIGESLNEEAINSLIV